MRYSTKKIEPNMAKSLLVDAPISAKASIEISNHIRGKSIEKARTILELSSNLKRPIPYKRFTNGPGHKRGSGVTSGRFSVNACQKFLELLAAAESNARDKGLNTKDLIIRTLIVQRASRPFHYGRQSRLKMKRSHVEIIVQEASKLTDSKDKKESKEIKKEAAKGVKPEVKSSTTKKVQTETPKEKKTVKTKNHPKTEKKEEPKQEKESAPKVNEKMLKG